MRTIVVETPMRSCSVFIGRGTVSELDAWIGSESTVLLIADRDIFDTHGQQVLEKIQDRCGCCMTHTLESGESAKSLRQAARLYEFMVDQRMDRHSLIVALGGGTMGDLAGFVASTYMRGIRWIVCPTTLLAAIDSSIGGKTALNHAGVKNLVGSFYPPWGVVVDVEFLATLPAAAIRSAMAESLKHAMVADADFFEWQRRHHQAILGKEPLVLEELIEWNVKIKSAIVSRDERDETGERARLNFGHTLAHGFEAASEYRLGHGECVGLGMLAAARIAHELKMADRNVAETLCEALRQFGLPTTLPFPVAPDRLMRAFEGDKKTVTGRFRFVLPRYLGEVQVGCEVTRETIERAVESLTR